MLRRILNALLGLTVLTLLGMTVISLAELRHVSSVARSGNLGLASDAVRVSKQALDTMARWALERLAADEAALFDAKLEDVEDQSRDLAEAIGRLWQAHGAWREEVAHGGHRTTRRTTRPTTRPSRPARVQEASLLRIPPGAGPAARRQAGQRLPPALDILFHAARDATPGILLIEMALPEGPVRIFPRATNLHHGYDPRTRPWFQQAQQSRLLGWTAPYLGAVSGELQMTCYNPIYLPDGTLAAVLAIALSLESVSDRLGSVHRSDMGSAVLVTGRLQAVLQQPRSSARQPATGQLAAAVDGRGEPFVLDRPEEQRQLAQAVSAGRSGLLRAHHQGQEVFLAHAPVGSKDLAVLLLLSASEVAAPLRRTEARILSDAGAVARDIRWHMIHALLELCAAFIVVVGLVLWVARRMARRITAPLLELERGAQLIGRGELDHRITVPPSGDEIESLGHTVNQMAANLKQHVVELERTTTARARIEGELRLARQLQAAAMPGRFPPFPERSEIELFATMLPAREVGGDLYDFFFVDQQHLCLLLGDVADKGIPAALYMMQAKTLLRVEAEHTLAPDEILCRANRLLAADNPQSMFLTAICAILDLGSGELRFASAGHNPPLYRPAGATPRLVSTPADFVLGPLADSTYRCHSLTMRSGDILLLYTDGITEARDGQGEMFGDARLLGCAAGDEQGGATSLVRALAEEVQHFTSGVEQSDDIALLALRYAGPARAPEAEGSGQRE